MLYVFFFPEPLVLREFVSSWSGFCHTNPQAGGMEMPTKQVRTFLGWECHHPGFALRSKTCSNSEL